MISLPRKGDFRDMFNARRPSRTALASFAIALALTVSAALTIVVATGGDEPPQPQGTAFVPADPAPTVAGVEPLDRSRVGTDGLILGRIKVLPTGSVPTTGRRDFDARTPEVGDPKERLRPDEEARRWEPRFSDENRPDSLLVIPDSADWSVERGGAAVAVSASGAVRLLEEGVLISYRGSEHPWQLASGPMRPETVLEAAISERDSGNFTYTVGGVTAVVVDASPNPGVDRVWIVSLVLDDRWIEMQAPVVPFESVAAFLKSLVEANR
jgi:hypothetical protein